MTDAPKRDAISKSINADWNMEIEMRDARIAELVQRIAEKDAALDRLLELKDADFEEMNTKIVRQEKRIAELEAQIKEMNDIYTLESILNSDRSEP